MELDKAEIASLTWMKVPRTNQLGVLTKDGLKYKFTGFRDQVSYLPFLSVIIITFSCFTLSFSLFIAR